MYPWASQRSVLQGNRMGDLSIILRKGDKLWERG